MSDDISPDFGAHDNGDDSISVAYGDSSLDAGSAGFDADDHGLTDAAVQDHGYQVEHSTDTDGDGSVDQLTVTDEEGSVVSQATKIDGTWQPEPAGASTADVHPMDKFPEAGTDKEDTGADAGSGGDASAPGDETGSGADAGSGGDASAPGDEGLHSAMGSDGASTDTPTSADTPTSGSATGDEPTAPDSSADTASTDLTVSIDGEDIVVGAPTLDITGDGVTDTVVVESEGNVEYYVDTDQDGVADQIIVLDESDGTLVSHEVYDPATGEWTNVTDESTGTPD